MAKKISILLGAIAAVTVLGIGIYHSDASQKVQAMPKSEMSELINAQYPGEITKLELNDDAYEATIKSDVAEYELQLDAKSGDILKIKETQTLVVKEESKQDQDSAEDKTKQDKQVDQPKNKSNDNPEKPAKEKEATPKTSIESEEKAEKQPTSKPKAKDTQKSEEKSKKKQEKKEKKRKTVISQDEAINIALAQFSGEVDDVDLDEEDGRLIYEIEIERGDLEAEIMIDAYTGEIIIMEIDD